MLLITWKHKRMLKLNFVIEYLHFFLSTALLLIVTVYPGASHSQLGSSFIRWTGQDDVQIIGHSPIPWSTVGVFWHKFCLMCLRCVSLFAYSAPVNLLKFWGHCVSCMCVCVIHLSQNGHAWFLECIMACLLFICRLIIHLLDLSNPIYMAVYFIFMQVSRSTILVAIQYTCPNPNVIWHLQQWSIFHHKDRDTWLT